ncbi:poly [ADP-ribose] polymerase tankyrase-like isoform X2 [Sycon ciliatum]|uniref:poly [ADP-ribose] polymerase tankyrase-like isoform X2 n=1 Tax=Sycon ciliatum TaxID=27933 RepID=UPI0031F6A448
MPRARRKGPGRNGEDSAATPSAAASQTNDAAGATSTEDEDVEQAELQTIGSRLRSRRGDTRGPEDILLYDGDLIAYGGGSVDPEVGYHLVEVFGTVPVEYEPQGAHAIIDGCPYFNEQVGVRGCLWMPLGMGRVGIRRASLKWVSVKATTGLKDDRVRVSWSEHKRIQRELGVQGQITVDDDEDLEEEDDDADAESDGESGDDPSDAFAFSPGAAATQSSQRRRRKASSAATAPRTASASGGGGGGGGDDGDGSDNDDDQPPAKKPRGGRRSAGSSPGKPARSPKPPKPVKYKKGFVAPRPGVDLLDTDPIFSGDSPVKGGNTLHALDIIRAVNRKDQTLLKKLFADVKNVSAILYSRSPVNPASGLSIGICNADLQVLTEYHKTMNPKDATKREVRVREPPSSLRYIQSGSVGIATFGHAVGAVGAARGGRELHNAMLANWTSMTDSVPNMYVLSHLFQHCSDMDFFERVKALYDLQHQAMLNMYQAVRFGNRAMAQHMVKKMLGSGGWDMNALHLQSLSDDGKPFDAFREVSVTKKGGSNNKSIAPVHMAAINPDSKYLAELLKVHGDNSVSDSEQWRIVHYAAACTADGPLRLLLEKGADMMCVTKEKESPLMIASRLGRADNVKLLVADKQNIELLLKQKDRQANTVLHLAALNGHVDVADTLIGAGAKEVGCNQNHMTPMGVAAAFGHLDVIKKMKDKGFSIVKPDRRQRPPLILACREGQVHVVRYLLHHGADADCADSSGNTAAHYAAAYGWLPVLKVLVEEGGANSDPVASWKATPLSCAALKHQAECVNYLVSLKDVNLNVIDGQGRTIAANLCMCPSFAGLSQLKLLIERGADITIADAAGMTPLHHLCASTGAFPAESRNELIELFASLLLDSGADAEGASKNGSTPLLCTLNGHSPNMRAASFLVEHGVKVTAVDEDGRNPLHYAVKQLGEDTADALIAALLKHGDADKLVNSYESSGNTPLLLALQAVGSYVSRVSYWNKEEMEKKANHARANVKKMISNKNIDINLPRRRTRSLKADSPPPKDDSDAESYSDCESRSEEEDSPYEDEDMDCSDDESRKKQVPVAADGKLSFELVNEDDEAMFRANPGDKLGYTTLHYVAEQTDEKWQPILDTVLKRSEVNVDLQCVGGLTALQLALKGNNNAAARKLLNAKADVNKQNIEGQSALLVMTPGQKGNTLFKTVLKFSDLTLQDRKGRTALHLAGMAGDRQLAQDFLEAGCELNTVDHLGRTALHYAVATGAARADASSDLEAMLLKRGCDINAVDVFGRSAVHYAFLPAEYVEPSRKTPEERAVVAPLEKVMELTEKSEASNHSKYDPIETVYCLFSVGKGTKVDPLDKFGRSPLHYAAKVSALTCSLHLISQGAELNLKDSVEGTMPLRMALCYNNPEYAIMMMQKGAQTTPGEITNGKDVFSIEVTIESVFYIAVQRGWLGVSYMIFDSDFPLFDGLRDAMLTQKYILTCTLMKKVDDDKLQIQDEQKRGLLHWLAISSSCSVDNSIVDVVDVLVNAGVDVNVYDVHGRTALHYAAQRACRALVTALADRTATNVNILDKDGKSPLVLAVQGNRRITSTSKLELDKKEERVAELLGRGYFNSPIAKKAPLCEEAYQAAALLLCASAERCIRYSDAAYSDGATTLLCHAVRQGNKELFDALMRTSTPEKKKICEMCDEKGMSPLAHAIVLNETAMATSLIAHSDVSWKGEFDRTLVHLVVKPVEYGSYENVDLLKKLAKADAPLSDTDENGKTPMHYAKLQDSGCMAAALQKLGAAAPMPGLSRDRTVWKKFADRPYSADEDCLAYITETAAKEKVKPPPDHCFEKKDTSTVYEDDAGILFDVLLNKVDLSHGAFGYNNYYRMQVLHESVQDAYYLWTHWGRWGDDQGMYQRTPFGTVNEACTEFQKIFRSKTGNDFVQSAKDKSSFTAQAKKYSLMSTDCSHMLVSSLLMPIDLDSVPDSTLDKTLQSTLKYLMDVTVLRDRATMHGLSKESAEKVLMFGEASAEKIFQAKSVLLELHPLVKSYNQLRYQPNCDIEQLMGINNRIVKLSQKYYEIMPFAHTAFGGTGSSPMIIMSEEHILTTAMQRLEHLSDLSLTARILLAAWYRRKTMNPLDYVFKFMEASMTLLEPDSLERQVIETYMCTTAESYLKAVKLSALYKVERRGEPERMEKYRSKPTHRLLWHGSPQVNIIGILSQGLLLTRGNPSRRHFKPEDEENIWDGLYFADMFAKSYAYAGGRYPRHMAKYDDRVYMFLCEVALGNMHTNDQFKTITKIPANKDSLYCPGKLAHLCVYMFGM